MNNLVPLQAAILNLLSSFYENMQNCHLDHKAESQSTLLQTLRQNSY